MSVRPRILPDEALFADFRKQCLSTDNWLNKYDNSGMQVWVEVPNKKDNNAPKVHKIKVSYETVCVWYVWCVYLAPDLAPVCLSVR